METSGRRVYFRGMKPSTLSVLVGTLLYSGAVFASPGGPTWETIGVGAVGIIIAGLGAYAKGISGRVDKLEARQAEMNTAMLREYHTKDDVRELVGEVRESMKLFHVEMKASMNELKQRFDHFENIYGR